MNGNYMQRIVSIIAVYQNRNLCRLISYSCLKRFQVQRFLSELMQVLDRNYRKLFYVHHFYRIPRIFLNNQIVYMLL